VRAQTKKRFDRQAKLVPALVEQVERLRANLIKWERACGVVALTQHFIDETPARVTKTPAKVYVCESE
jgi:hypothetical protein